MKALDVELINQLKVNQKDIIRKELDSLSSLKESKGRAAARFKLTSQVVGQRKSVQEPTTILDPDTRVIVFNPREIKETVLKYC